MQVYRQSRNYENLNKRLFDGVGEYNIPPLKGASYKADNWISFNFARGCEEPEKHGTGLALALGFTTRQALLNYQGRGAYKAIVEAAKLKIENYAEMRLYDKDGWNGARFNLQNNFRNWDADKAVPDDKKAPAINIICDIPRAPIQQDDDSKTAIAPLSVSEMLKDLERGKTDGGADE